MYVQNTDLIGLIFWVPRRARPGVQKTNLAKVNYSHGNMSTFGSLPLIFAPILVKTEVKSYVHTTVLNLTRGQAGLEINQLLD